MRGHLSHVFLLTSDAAQAVCRDEGAGHDQGEAPEVVWEQVGTAALPARPELLELAAQLGDGDRFITGAVLERAVSRDGHREAGDRQQGQVEGCAQGRSTRSIATTGRWSRWGPIRRRAVRARVSIGGG